MEGAKVLAVYLEPLGFKFQLNETGHGSGERFTYGHFIKSGESFGKQRKIELHFRYSLGLVGYRIEGLTLSHQDYIALLGKHGGK